MHPFKGLTRAFFKPVLIGPKKEIRHSGLLKIKPATTTAFKTALRTTSHNFLQKSAFLLPKRLFAIRKQPSKQSWREFLDSFGQVTQL